MAAASRRCIVVRGTRARTRQDAARVTAGIARADVVWVCTDGPEGARSVSPRALDALLGQSVTAVVLDLHEALDPDAIARAEGLIRGGGALVLRMPTRLEPLPRRPDLAVHPHTLDDVGSRFARRFERCLPPVDDGVLAAPTSSTEATPEQDDLVADVAETLGSAPPTVTVVLADRGRGKSAGIGRALGRALAARPSLRIVVSARAPEAAAEVLRYAAPHALRLVSPLEAADAALDADVVVVDEAAQLPVALVKRIVTRHPGAHAILSTTCRGYEGTGRGFALRFVAWARARALPTLEHTLDEPIRWAADDPLERWAFQALLLDAEPARLAHAPAGGVRHVLFDRERLADDERTLRQLFGLLVHAHYRTTPSDLMRMLDAPNLDVHALLEGDEVVAASLVAREGSLPPGLADAMLRGERRVAGHALADTLVSHALRPEAAGLSMIRSVRIAVHDARRRQGLARRLVDAVHASYTPDLHGTIFGATAELVAFRRALGYEVVRAGVSRGDRSGEPAVVMVRPVSSAARALLASLRQDLAHEIEAQLALQEADDGGSIEPALRAALTRGLGAPAPRPPAELRALAERYACSAQPVDVVAGSLGALVRAHPSTLASLAPAARALLEARLVDHAAWSVVAARAGAPSVASAMRAMREAVRALLRAIED